MGRGDVPGAEQAFGEATRYMPSHVGSWHGLAWCQLLRGDFAAAQSSFDAALALDRNFGETHGGLAVVAALQGREAEARQAIERAVRLDRTGMSAQYAEAILGGEASNPRAVQALAMRLLRDRPGVNGAALLERALAARGAVKR
jgi:Tfp pilus assembly protein PilF